MGLHPSPNQKSLKDVEARCIPEASLSSSSRLRIDFRPQQALSHCVSMEKLLLRG